MPCLRKHCGVAQFVCAGLGLRYGSASSDVEVAPQLAKLLCPWKLTRLLGALIGTAERQGCLVGGTDVYVHARRLMVLQCGAKG